MKRIVIITLIAIVVLFAGLAIVTYASLDSVIKAAVERVGSDVTGTQVTLDEADIEPIAGKGSLRGFRMTNPHGFRRDSAFRFEEVSVSVDTGSLGDEVIVLHEVSILKPQITYEFADIGTNLDTIRENIERKVEEMQGESPTPAQNEGQSKEQSQGQGQSKEQAAGPPQAEEMKFIIRNLYFRDGTVSLAATNLTERKITTPLPDIHLTNIGSESGGVSPAVILDEAFGAVITESGRALSTIDLEAALTGLGSEAEAVRAQLERHLDVEGARLGRAVESGAAEAGRALESGANEAGKAIDRNAKEVEGAVRSLFD